MRGFNNKLKRRALFNQLRKQKIDIARLQETYVKNDTIQDIKREWKGKIFYRIGTSRSNGLLIFIDSKLVYEAGERNRPNHYNNFTNTKTTTLR